MMSKGVPPSSDEMRAETTVFDALLRQLKQNKPFPRYAAERRIDIFINIFLEAILSHGGNKVVFVAPEFPLWDDRRGKGFFQLDYLCAFESTNQPVFVELKTDASYFQPDRAKDYVRKARSWKSCIEELKTITSGERHTSHEDKYLHLVKSLHQTGLIDLSSDALQILRQASDSVSEHSFRREDTSRISEALRDISRGMGVHHDRAAKLIYIAPDDDDIKSKLDSLRKDNDLEIELLDFTYIEATSTDVETPFPGELRRLALFLKNL
jgi:hypothetical protein